MAATGYTPISLYNSTSAGVQPTTGNLVAGELALNITDGKLYYKDTNTNTIKTLATAANTNISLPSSIATGGLIVGNGTNTTAAVAIGANGYVLTSNGTTAAWAANSGVSAGKSIALSMIFGF